MVARLGDRTNLNVFTKNVLTMLYVERTVTDVVLDVVKEDFRINVLQSDR